MKRLLYLFVLLLSLSLWSCGSKDDGIDDPDVPENPEQPENPENPDVPEYVELYVSEYDLVLGAQGDEVSFDIECNTKWSIENESGWCKTDVASGEGDGTVKVTAEAYYENEDRNAVLTVKAGNETRTVQVTQKHEDALILSKDKFDVAQEGGTISVEWQSNVDCRLTIPWKFDSWIKEAPKSKGMETTTFDLVISANEAFEKREGFVVVSGNGLKDTVHIYQVANERTLILNQASHDVPAEGGTVEVELKSNVNYRMTIPTDARKWISQATTRALRVERFVFRVAANTSYDSRKAAIVFEDRNSDLSDTLYICQKQTDALLLGKKKFTVSGKGENIEVGLKSNIDYEVILPDWISRLQTKALVEEVLTFQVAKNDGQDVRKGEIVIKDKKSALSETIRVVQGTAEIYPGDLVFSSVDDVKAFAVAGYKKIAGSLTITGSLVNLTNLDNQLEEVRDNLIFDCSSLNSFDGLYGLKRIGGNLTIKVGQFTSFEGLNNLGYIGGSFRITSSLGSLQNFSGLGSLTEIVGDFEISSYLKSLENFVGLDNLRRIGGSFRITSSSSSLKSLQNFSGLGSLTEIVGDFEVSSSSSLESLENFVGLDNLCRIGGSFRITSSNDYYSSSLESLQNFSGLGSLTEIVGDFEVSSSSRSSSLGSLENFVGLDNLGRIGGSFRITSSSSYYDSSSSSRSSSLASLQNFSGLGSLTEIVGDFEVSSFSDYSSSSLGSLENFVGLDNLCRIGGSFRITSSSFSDYSSSSSSSLGSLENFVGLDNLCRIGGSFRITSSSSSDYYYYYLGSLQNFSGLGSLTAIGGDFISEDKFLSAETGLEKLVTVGGEMNVRLSYNGDAHFTALQSVGGALSLSSSSSSQSNLNLPALKTVPGAFRLENFQSVDIPKLESIEGVFTITGVNAIGTLDNLKTVGDITIKNCKELTDFCNWKPVLTGYNGTFSVSGCGYNPTKYQILNGACSKLPEE